MSSIKDSVFLVTGATSGIGKLLVKQLVTLGAKVAFCGRSQDKMQSLLQELNDAEQQVFYRAFDITDYQAAAQFVTDATAHFGHIDVLVNNAGVNSARGGVSELDIADLEWMTKVNMFAPFEMMKQVFNHSMAGRKQGTIINVMSTVCGFANEGIGAYTASKSGFDGLTKVFRKEVREQGIKVCNLYPGGVDTPFREADRPLYLDAQDVVQAVLFMAEQSDKASIDELTVRPLVEKNYS